MAGHSQFKNIMHKKGKQDAIRSKLFSKLAREITVAAKMGLPDPAMNPRLRAAIIAARAENMPKDNIDRALRLAEQLGGESVTLQGEDVIAEILNYAREHNCTQLVVGRSRRRGWRRLFADSITARLLAQSGAFDVPLPISPSLYSKLCGKSIRTRCSAPVTGLRIGSPFDDATPGTSNRAVRLSTSTSSSIFA